VFSRKPRIINSTTTNECHSWELASCLPASIKPLGSKRIGETREYANLRSRRTHKDVFTWASCEVSVPNCSYPAGVSASSVPFGRIEIKNP
jgi:hypothetical protein